MKTNVEHGRIINLYGFVRTIMALIRLLDFREIYMIKIKTVDHKNSIHM